MINEAQLSLPMKLTSYPLKTYFLTCAAPRTKSKGLPIGGPFERPEKATRGGVNGSQSKFLYKNWHMSQVQTQKPKPYKKEMNTPTNIIEMIPSKL
jgi:hypothetical protein